jgi:diguanylate cyclase (GGDEF)-like protein/PAS domain S-box-containing protein
MVAYGALYLAWQVFHWGGPDLELVIADAAFIPLGVLGVAFAVLAARRSPTDGGRRAWFLIGLALAAFSAGDIAWFILEIVLATQPYPSIADAGYLAFYPLALAGLIALPRERPESRFRTLLDLAIVAGSLGIVVWWLVLKPVAAAGSSSGLEHFVALAYPVGDLLLLIGLAVAFMSRLVGTSRVALLLLGGGLVLNVIADLSYARVSLAETYTSGTWMDALWMIGWVLMGLAGFVQARSTADIRRSAMVSGPANPVTFLPYVAVACVYGVLLVASEINGSNLQVVVVGALGATGLVVRQFLTGRENARLLADRASGRSAARFQAIIQNANDVIVLVDPAGVMTYLTPSVTHLVGRTAESLLGSGIDELIDRDDLPLALELVRAATNRPGTGRTIECRVRTLSGVPCHVEVNVTNLLDDPVVTGLVLTMRDVTERRDFEEQLRHQAFHDPLTGLPNRVLLAERTEQALRRRGAAPSLLYLDLDDFKVINDSLGHPVGDRVLIEVARRLSRSIRAEDTAARLGGDEFAVLMDATGSVDEVVVVADRILGELRRPVDVDGSAVAIGASIGIVCSMARPAQAADLLRDADIAMYEAKREARGSYRVFEKAMFVATVERVNLEADLRTALAAGQLDIVYQPLFDLPDNRLVSVEALLRWNHPTRGLVMPDQFIPLAERTGEIAAMGRWVIERACLTVGEWNASRNQRIRANVNVSARQLEPRFVEDVTEILRRTGFPPRLLVLEVTESVVSADQPAALEVLGRLRSIGVRISIDDFGTGYSSLSVLRDLPVDELKIDRSFVSRLTIGGDSSLVETIIRLSHDFNLSTVAEGIEFEEQLDVLRRLGCDVGQGYLLGRPGPAHAIGDLIAAAAGRSSGAAAGRA